MKKKSKYYRQLAPLLKKTAFTSREARHQRIPSRMLSYYCKQGILERISRGIFRNPNKDWGVGLDLEGLIHTAASVPEGVVCLISALCYYRLTDQIMRQYWIAIPNKNFSPKREHIRVLRMRNMILGKTVVKVGKAKMKIFDRERTVVDAFRYLSHEIAIKALQAYLKTTDDQKPDLQKLKQYAKILRVNITPYILAYTT
jgi:predicted transcriptional regulator of viral defense system